MPEPRLTITSDGHSQLLHIVPVSTFSGRTTVRPPEPIVVELPASPALWLRHIVLEKAAI